MPEDTALELVTLRNTFYRDNYRRVLGALLLMIVINIGLGGVIFYQIYHRPKPVYFATTSEGRIIKLQPLSMPVVSKGALMQWAAEAAMASYSYTFSNYRRDLQAASDYYTPDGWKNFQEELRASRNLETVLAKKLNVSAVASGAPTISEQGRIGGAYAWRVQIPLTIKYESASVNFPQYVLVTMLIKRVSTLNYPKGIAIQSFVAQTRQSPS